MKKRNVSVLLREETIQRLDQIRAETHRSRSNIIRMFIKHSLKDQKLVESLNLQNLFK